MFRTAHELGVETTVIESKYLGSRSPIVVSEFCFAHSVEFFLSESVFLVNLFVEHLEGLHQLLKGISMMKELTLRTRDYLVSFGECMSTRLFSAYLNKIGHKARQVCCFITLWS